MKIPPTPAAATGSEGARPAPVPPERALLESLNLRQGQATLARVLAQITDAPNPGAGVRLMLEIGGQSIPVDSDMELPPGTLLKLQRVDNTLRMLEILGRPSANILHQGLAQKLPAQFDLQTGLKLIAALSRAIAGPPISPAQASTPAATASGAALPDGQAPLKTPAPGGGDIRRALSQITALMPQQVDLQNTSPAGSSADSRAARVQLWVQNSGLFTEAMLARADLARPAPTDLKSQLLRLAVQLLKTDTATASADLSQLRPAVSPDLVQQALQFPLTPVPGNQRGLNETVNAGVLLRVIAGMINRITVNQLHSQSLSTAATADGTAPPQTWLLELPWLNPQQDPRVVQVRIERHDDGEANEDSDKPGKKQLAQWRLNLALDLDELGPLYFELALTQKALAAKIWAKEESTWRLADRNVGRLRNGLGALGLAIKSLECRHGQPPQTPTRLDRRLVDEKA